MDGSRPVSSTSFAPKILVIDDDPSVAQAVASACAHQGASIAMASDRQHVRTLLQSAPPDGIILDIGAPGRDGIDLLHDIADLAPGASVLVMSGHGDAWLSLSPAVGERVGRPNVVATQKPIRLGTLRDFVASLRSGPA